MYTIKRASEMTGLTEGTLRVWERRYGIVKPMRSEGGYRLYDDDAIRTISLVPGLVQQGWSPKNASAEIIRRREDGRHFPVAPPEVTATREIAEVDLRFRGLVAAAAALDPVAADRELDIHLDPTRFEDVADSWLMPAVRALGTAWSDGLVTIAGEHLVTRAIARRLATAYDIAGRNAQSGGRRLVIGLPPGQTHEIGLMAFAVLARRAGMSTTYLGADLPSGDWAIAASRLVPDAIVLSIAREEDLRGLNAVATTVRAHAPGVRIAVGGQQQDDAPEPCIRLGHELLPAVHRLQAVLDGAD